MPYAIEGIGLQKTFVKKRSLRELIVHPLQRAQRVHALRGVDIAVREGEVFSLLGPNGAGKTTLLKIFSCLVLPDTGRALVAGEDTVNENRVKPRIGLVHSDERSFYWRLSARQNLRFFARLYDVPSRRIESRVAELLGRMNMTADADRPFSELSSGMKQRIAIARALLHDPPILLMDEPTRSLDPAASLALRSFILDELKGRDGKTVLLATHNLREAEVLSDRVAILVQGRLREIGTVGDVRRWGLREDRYVLELAPVGDKLEGPFRIEADETTNGLRKVTLSLEGEGKFEEMLRWLVTRNVPVRSCVRLEPDLEQAFSRIIAAEEAKA